MILALALAVLTIAWAVMPDLEPKARLGLVFVGTCLVLAVAAVVGLASVL